jgi:drug/metabolite transporter (DMT)-like permease
MPYIGEIAALSAALLWSFTSFVFTEASFKIGTYQLNVDRMILSGLMIIVTVLLMVIPVEITNTQLMYLTLSGVIGLVLGDGFLFSALKQIGPRLSMLIMSFNPAIATICAYFILGESLGLAAIIGMVLTLFGIVIVVMERPKSVSKFKVTPKGLLYAVLAATGQGVGLILAKMANMEGEINSFTATLYRILSSVIIMLPIGFIIRQYKNPIKIYIKNKKLLLLITIGAIIGPYLGITLSFIAVTKTEIGIASTLLSTMPIIMLPLSYFFYKEKLSMVSIGGALVAVGGVAMLFLFQ